MASRESRLTAKGQVTIPAGIRALLGLKPGDKVQFEVRGVEVVMKPAVSRLARHSASVPVQRVLTRQQEREEFEIGVAEEVLSEG